MIVRAVSVLVVLASGCRDAPAPGPAVVRPEAGLPPSAPLQPEDGSVQLRLDRADYRLGDTLRIRVANGLGVPVGFNVCHDARVERQDGPEWVPIAREADIACEDILLLADADAVWSSDAWGRLALAARPLRPGTHRVVLPVSPEAGDGERVVASSAPFRVHR